MFDDYLSLGTQSFSRDRLVVFTGRSGSGKSTAIRFLLEEHRDFRERPRVILEGPPFAHLDRAADVAVLDDLTSAADLLAVGRLLRRSRTLLVASHLNPAWFAPLRAAMRCSLFRTDDDARKLERYLESRGVSCSRDALRRYEAEFGATYTDLDIILERCPAASLDASLSRFLKFNRIRESGRRAAQSQGAAARAAASASG